MINSNIFNYINVLDKAADAAYTRNDILANNIANDSTPNYKRKDVQFESLLQASLAGGGKLDDKVEQLNQNLGDLEGFVYTDHSSLSYRLDGNNVDIDVEEAELASNQLMYDGIIEGLNKEFERMKSVLSK